jgi:hypothetical protein
MRSFMYLLLTVCRWQQVETDGAVGILSLVLSCVKSGPSGAAH